MYFEKVKELMVETLNLDAEKITAEAKLNDDLDVDSLDSMEVIMALEETYHITIDPDALANFVTVGDIAKYLEENV